MRVQGKAAPNYGEVKVLGSTPSKTKPKKKNKTKGKKQGAVPAARSVSAQKVPVRASNPRSCRNLKVDFGHLDTFLGNIIPPMGGQVKRAVMEEASADGSPTFSRMSGIQEFKNAVLLFINIYGDGYKNVFLDGGRQITWFAQNRQWEGTPVVQRLINCEGGKDVTGKTIRQTPVLLFCRCLGKGYVFCGRLGYCGHDPERIPIRFVWELKQFQDVSTCVDFQDLITACDRILSPPPK